MVITDLLTIAGLLCFLAGLYLLAGLPTSLMALGLVLMLAGARVARFEGATDDNEPDETTAIS